MKTPSSQLLTWTSACTHDECDDPAFRRHCQPRRTARMRIILLIGAVELLKICA
jgi:hypothetical protein